MEKDLLIELGTEEIPARFISDGQQNFGETLVQWLEERYISFESYETFSTPRRLAVRVKSVADRQEDRLTEARGPSLHVAQNDDGSWSTAAIGFARKQGVNVDQLEVKEHKGNAYVYAKKYDRGAKTIDLLQAEVHKVFQSLTFPLSMRWGQGYRFIRPVRWIVCLYDEEIIPLKWFGVESDRISQGHRFLGSDVSITTPAIYISQLQNQYVWVDVDKRRDLIVNQLQDLEQKHDWVIPIEESLLDEVTNLVEYPTVIVGQFEPDFLTLPKSVLITTMREHQRYFPVENKQSELLPYFVTVRNGDDQHVDTVIRGNEKVLHARLADARFFFEEDLKLSIDDSVIRLDRIVFRKELGTMGERVRRIRKLSSQIAEELGFDDKTLQLIDRAAQISKFDLATQMVDEFSKLEGDMGYEYAKEAGEDPEVAKAIREHHRPRFAGDQIPQNEIGVVLSLADKMDMIAACFGIGLVPSGSQDPYSLRRNALGIIQILLSYPRLSLEFLYDLTLNQLEATQLLQHSKDQVKQKLSTFFSRRFRTILNETNIRFDVIDAVLAREIANPQSTLRKAKVLMSRIDKEEFKNEVEAFTRTANLVYANRPDVLLNQRLFEHPAEHSLFQTYQEASTAFQQAFQERNQENMYQSLTKIVSTIHYFFDHVMVMVEEPKIRQNRLALLQLITQLTEQFADFRKIVFP